MRAPRYHKQFFCCRESPNIISKFNLPQTNTCKWGHYFYRIPPLVSVLKGCDCAIIVGWVSETGQKRNLKQGKMFQTLKRMCKSSVVKSIGFDSFSRRRPGGWFPNDVIVNKTIIPNNRHLGFSLCPQRACLHGDGGPLKGEVTYGGLPHLSCKRD